MAVRSGAAAPVKGEGRGGEKEPFAGRKRGRRGVGGPLGGCGRAGGRVDFLLIFYLLLPQETPINQSF